MKIENPRFRLLLVGCLVVTTHGLLPKVVRAETRTAASLTPEAVWEAIDAAKDGDTVQLPAGTAVWTKGWNTGHWAKMKAITVQGAGMDKTVIRDHRSSRGGIVPFELKGVEGKPFRDYGHYLRRNRLGRRRPMGRVHVDQRHLQEFPHRPLQVQECRA